MPVFGSGVSPGHSVVRFRGEEFVCNAEIVDGAKLKESLSVFIEFAYANQ